MKNKLIILSLLLAGSAVSASAQNKEKFYSESWQDNIFVSVGVGAQGTTNPDSKFGKSVTPLINVSVGKLINPVWGVRGQVYGWSSKMNTSYPFASVNSPAVDREENYFGINLDGMLNLTNLFLGYKPGRLFELNFFAGPSMNVVKNYGGWNSVYVPVKGTNADGKTVITDVLDPSKSTPTDHAYRCLVGASLGLGAKFNINQNLAIDLEARGQVTPSILGAYSSASTDGYIHLTAGVTYTFGGKKFASCSSNSGSGMKMDQNINNEVNRYRSELTQTQTELADAKNALSNVKPVTTEVVKELVVAGPRAIFFQVGKSTVDDYGKVNLALAAKVLKANPDKKYKIVGYADKATGNSTLNKKLSEMRAQAVYDALVQEGVSKDQLELVGCGDATNLFDKDSLNRVVILE